MNQDQVKKIVARGLTLGARSVRGSLNPVELSELMTKVLNGRPERLEEYAFRTGRNAVIDMRRHEEAVIRMAQRRQERAAKSQDEALSAYAEYLDLEAAKRQWTAFVQSLPKTRSSVRAKQLEMVRLRVLEGVKGETLIKVFPGTSADVRDQWKRRGLKLILKSDPPEELRRVLQRSTIKI